MQIDGPTQEVLYHARLKCARSTWRAAYDYLQRGVAAVVSRHATEAQSAPELLSAVAARAPQSAWRQFLAERRAVDVEGCCRPNGVVETLLAELRLLPLHAVLASPALPCSAAPPGKESANYSASVERFEPQAQVLSDSMGSNSTSADLHNAQQPREQTATDSSSDGAAETAARVSQRRQADALQIESLCMLMLMVPTAAWHSIADAQVQMRSCPCSVSCPYIPGNAKGAKLLCAVDIGVAATTRQQYSR